MSGDLRAQGSFKQRPGRAYRTSTGQEMLDLEGTGITDRESCRSVTDDELECDRAISQISQLVSNQVYKDKSGRRN